jgi:hypothetical protein
MGGFFVESSLGWAVRKRAAFLLRGQQKGRNKAR